MVPILKCYQKKKKKKKIYIYILYIYCIYYCLDKQLLFITRRSRMALSVFCLSHAFSRLYSKWYFTVSADSWLPLCSEQGIMGRFFIAVAVATVVICSSNSKEPRGLNWRAPLLAQQPLSHRNSWKSVRWGPGVKASCAAYLRSIFSVFFLRRAWRKQPRFRGQKATQARKIMWSVIETRDV